MPLNFWLPDILAIAIIFLFFSIERKLRIGKEAKALDPSQKDGNSTAFIAVALITTLLSLFAAPVLNSFTVCTIQNSFTAYGAIPLMLCGFYIRVLSARTLGRFYTRTLKTVDAHQIVDTGIYKYIRHPGYLGTILLFVSGGLASNNYISLFLSISLILPAYIHRVQTEERMLEAQFGEKYKAYKKKTYRLLPGVY